MYRTEVSADIRVFERAFSSGCALRDVPEFGMPSDNRSIQMAVDCVRTPDQMSLYFVLLFGGLRNVRVSGNDKENESINKMDQDISGIRSNNIV